jgi:hypothetical protein
MESIKLFREFRVDWRGSGIYWLCPSVRYGFEWIRLETLAHVEQSMEKGLELAYISEAKVQELEV